MELTYKVSDIKAIIQESANEFKAKLGPNVESEDKKNNDKAYKDAAKRAKDYDGGLEEKTDDVKIEKLDNNATTLDYEPENMSDDYKERIHAQAKGYASAQEEKNGIEKSGDYDKNEKIYQAIKKSGHEAHQNRKAFAKSGLQASKLPDEVFDRNEMYESKDGFTMRGYIDMLREFEEEKRKNVIKPVNEKRIYFKKTTFLSEEHMFSRIPDEFKNNGQRFIMEDKTGNKYLIEWKNNKGVILEHSNVNGCKEAINEMKRLMNYKSEDSKTSRSMRANEDEAAFVDVLNKARKIND